MVPRNPSHPTTPSSSSSSSSLSPLSPSPPPQVEKSNSRRKRAKTAHVTANEIAQEENTIDKEGNTNQSLSPPQDKNQQQQQPTRRGRKTKNISAVASSTKPSKGKASVNIINNNRKRKTGLEKTKVEEENIENNNDNNNKKLIGESKKHNQKEEKIQKECSEEDKEDDNAENAKTSSKPQNPKKRKRKTKEVKTEEGMPLAARLAGSRFFIGAHVSAAKGVQNAVKNCLHIGGNAFALFLKSQRKWENPPLQDEHRVLFKDFCAEHKYDSKSHILPHGSYLVNLAHEDPIKAKQSYDCFLDDLHRCEALGIGLYNFHPGASNASAREPAIARIAAQLNASHAATHTVTTVLETMAGAGTSIGSTFNDLASIISLINDKSRIGICLDTCHIFAAGYDLRSPSAFAQTLNEFDTSIGLQYLKAVHLNDSKAPLGSRLDRHANIGTGFLGLGAFWNIMNDERFEGVPMVLETPDEDAEGKEDKGIYAREIKLLESLVGMEREGEEFRELERELASRGEKERKVALEKFEKKEGKAAREKGKGNGKGRGKDKGRGLDKWVSRKGAKEA